MRAGCAVVKSGAEPVAPPYEFRHGDSPLGDLHPYLLHRLLLVAAEHLLEAVEECALDVLRELHRRERAAEIRRRVSVVEFVQDGAFEDRAEGPLAEVL